MPKQIVKRVSPTDQEVNDALAAILGHLRDRGQLSTRSDRHAVDRALNGIRQWLGVPAARARRRGLPMLRLPRNLPPYERLEE